MRFTLVLTILFLGFAGPAWAQQAVDIDQYRIHYNALKTSELPAEVMRAYDIQRSPNRVLVNIAILDTSDAVPTPVKAVVTGDVRNLIGQKKDLQLREINEAGEAIYYIGTVRVAHMETLRFTIVARVSGRPRPLEIEFLQQFYTE